METAKGTEVRSVSCGEKGEEVGVESLQFGEEIQTLMSVPPETGSSFTALLELQANQAMELFHSPKPEETPAIPYHCSPIFAPPENSAATMVKKEPIDPDSVPVVSNNRKSTKRKEREKKVKESAKKSKEVAKDGEELPYVHVRARRGQATDSHSLAERARREKINARMKLLQELVPGCNKISGTAMVLDEIINHVQTLQRQVEFLSRSLAAVDPIIDISLDSLFDAENGSPMECNLPGMVMPSIWPEGQLIGNRQQYQHLWQFDGLHRPIWGREEVNPNFVTPENSLLSHDSSANAASLHSSQLKMEL